ncbi:MAG: hypothetical protein HRU09_07765 [Oligoflexales bacterium]|nr:hypothetical protein [Oligoflexales bacterium]
MTSKLLIALSIVYIFCTQEKTQAKNLGPILFWSEELTPLPILDLVFLDPEMKHTSINQKSLESLLEQWQNYEDPKSKEYSKKTKNQLWQNINFLNHLNHLLVMNHYRNDIMEIKGHKTSDLSAQIRRKLSLVIGNLLAQSLEPEEKALLTFQKFLIDFQNPNLRRNAVTSINKAQTQNLSDQRKRLILFGSYLLNLYDKDSISQEAIHGLNHLSPYMTKEAYTLTQLYLARLKLGFHYVEKQQGDFHPTYSRHLKMISNLCSSFSDTQNTQILAAMLSIWTKAKNFKEEWSTPPFNTACYQDLVPYLATRERVALKHWRKKKHEEAYHIYDKIAQKTAEESKQVLIQKRILRFAKILYEQDQDIIFYQGVFVKALNLVAQSQFRMQLRARLFEVTKKYLDSAYHKYSAIPNLENIVKTFLVHSGSLDNSRSISVLEAKILHRDQSYEKAWKAYYKLSSTTKKTDQRILDLKEAIKNYALYCKWSLSKPWTNLKSGPKSEYQRFEGLHYELLSLTTKQDEGSWHTASNLGMLHLINEKAEKAYALWGPYWQKNPNIKNIDFIQGALITKLYEHQSWNLVAEILAFIKDHKLTPKFDGKPIQIDKYQEKATYEIGKKALANMELLKAEQAFENLIHNFQRSPYYADYLANLVETTRLLHKYKPLRKYLEKYLAIGKNHSDYQKNLLALINLLKGMGKIEETFTYAKKYSVDFPDPNQPSQQLDLLLKLCKILPNKKYCQEKSQHKPLTEVAAKLDSYQIFKQKIFRQLQKVKKASKEQDSKKLREIEKELTSLGKGNSMVKDTINFVWFSQIKIISDSLIKKLRSRTIGNDEAVKHYENIRQTFLGICNRKRVSSCAQSFKELLALTIEMKSFLALSNSRSLLNRYSELESKLRKRMARYVSRNITEPAVAQKILWDTMKEWNFNEDPYSGIGYIQLIEYAGKPQVKG